jgi:hypothetical protein
LGGIGCQNSLSTLSNNAPLTEQVVDIPTRPGVTQRFLLLTPEKPQAAVILFAGGHGGLGISAHGNFSWGEGDFLVRSRRLFAEKGLMTALVDAPSDQPGQSLADFRQQPEHAADIKVVIGWLREQTHLPVWLVGTSRGTLSAAYVATQLLGEAGPDGLVLTATILTDNDIRAVPDMELGLLTIPVLVVHHEEDACAYCPYRELPRLMNKLTAAPRKEMITPRGGKNEGRPCGFFAYHNFNGLEAEVVRQIAAWILAPQ